METNTMEKMKKVLLSLCILGGLTTAFVAQNTYAAPEVSTLSASEQKTTLKRLKDADNYRIFPEELKKQIKEETILGKDFPQEDHQIQKFNSVFYDKDDGLFLYVIVDQYGKDALLARRTKASAKDIAEPVPAVNPKANHFPLPPKLIAMLKKEGTADKIAPIIKMLNENLELSLQVAAFNPSKLKKGDYIGKLVDMPLLTFTEIPAVTQNMDPEELALRKKLGFAFKSMTDVPGLILANSSSICNGIAYVHPRVGDIRSDDLAGESMVITGQQGAHLFVIEEVNKYVLSAKETYYKQLTQNFNALMLENGVEPGTDIAKMKGQSAEKMALALIGNMLKNYLNNLDRTMAAMVKAGRGSPSPYSLFSKMGKPNANPPKDKSTAAIVPITRDNISIGQSIRARA